MKNCSRRKSAKKTLIAETKKALNLRKFVYILMFVVALNSGLMNDDLQKDGA